MAVIIYYSENNSCLSSQSQSDVASNVFTPPAAATSNIGLCQIYDSDEKVCTTFHNFEILKTIFQVELWSTIFFWKMILVWHIDGEKRWYLGLSWGVLYKLYLIKIESFEWHTPVLVCSGGFDSIDAESACNTLGYSGGGTFSQISMLDRWTESEIPISMDGVECASASTDFLTCTTGSISCDHGGYEAYILLTCSDSG